MSLTDLHSPKLEQTLLLGKDNSNHHFDGPVVRSYKNGKLKNNGQVHVTKNPSMGFGGEENGTVTPYGTFHSSRATSIVSLRELGKDRSSLNLFLSVLVITFGSNFQIYNTGVVNNVQFMVQEWLNQSFIDRYQLHLEKIELDMVFSIAASANLFGGIFGALLTRSVAESLGRRRGLMFNSVINIIGALLAGLAKAGNSYEMLLIGRLLIGVSLGLGFGIAGMYLTEMPPVKYRGTTGTVQQIFVGFSDFFALAITLHFLLGTEELWPYAFGLPVIPSAIQFLYLAFYCHESPRYLFITQGNEKAALESVLFFQGPDQLQQTLADLRKEAESTRRAKAKNIGLKEMFTRSEYRKPLIVAVCVMSATTMSGIAPVMSYSTDMFVAMGLNFQVAVQATVGVGFCNFIMPFLIIFLIDRVGRRVLYLTMLWGCLISLSALSIFSYLSDAMKYSWAGTLAIVALISYQLLFAVGAPVSWIIASELFETHTRSFATSITGLIFWSLGTALVFGYLPFKNVVGISLSFLPFIISLILGIAFLTRALPETKGRTVENIAAQFRSRNVSMFSEQSATTTTKRRNDTDVNADEHNGIYPKLVDSSDSAYLSNSSYF